jgi:cation diffusion facilitator CzcD-associated flavoprotein CzcO
LSGLDDLGTAVRRDLALLNMPPANWPLGAVGPDGRRAVDVLIIGAGQFGQTAGLALMRNGIRSIRVIDGAPRGFEGPWNTTARMLTLRSPKHLTGPDLGIPSLTFRSYYEARHGAAAWEPLYKIGRGEWVEYLLWLREVTGVPVENEVSLLALEPAEGLLLAHISSAAGDESVFARHVVFATGRDGAGGAALPCFPSLPDRGAAHGRVFHSGEPIDFTRFRGGHVAVLGASASAFDNAASALEAGAAATLFCRRRFLPQVNLTRGMVFSGVLRGFGGLDDAARWDWLTMSADAGTPPPHESVLRCERHPGFHLRFGTSWQDVVADAAGVTLQTDGGPERFDAVIFGTGFAVDLARLPALAAFHRHALLWADRVPAEAARRYPDLARFPYLDAGYGLMERAPGDCPLLGRIHLFGAAAAVSFGVLSGDIPALGPGAVRLSQSITEALFREEAPRHRAAIAAFEEPELRPTPYYVAPEARLPKPAGAR